MRLGRSRAAFLAVVLLRSSTASAEEWFDAYGRGLEALKQGKAALAVSSFERAIRLRPEPGRALITYGTNRLDEYHPYLRLAEAQLIAGDAGAARDALSRSAARGKEPAAERARLAQRVDTAEEVRRAASGPPPSLVAASSPAPATLAAAKPSDVPSAQPAPAATVGAPRPADEPAMKEPRRVDPERGPTRSAAATVEPRSVGANASPPPTVAPLPAGASPSPRPDVASPSGDSPGSGIALGLLLIGMGLVAWAFRGRARAGSPRPPAGLDDTRAITRLEAGSPAQGERFGTYRLFEPLGKGGMAAVSRAERGGETYALKRPLAVFLDDPEFVERFRREAEIGRTLHHPNIVRIHERGDVGGTPYFTMELVRGRTLQALLRERGALSPKHAATIVSQVAEALDYAHLKGVIHRDLKPSNIMILDDGAVKVMDYGIARARRFDGLTVTGMFLGTPEYAAPETAQGQPTGPRSDLYSLGVVFYEMVTGARPFTGDTPFITLQKHCTEAPRPPSAVMTGITRPLEEIILRLLAKDPADRYPGAEELLIDLREFLNRGAGPGSG